MIFPCTWQARSSARWWVWRTNRGNALCVPHGAAGGLTPGIPSLRCHQVALKYIFLWGNRIRSSVSCCSDAPEDYWRKLSTAWQWQNTSSLQAFGCHITSDSWWSQCTVQSNKIKYKQHTAILHDFHSKIEYLFYFSWNIDNLIIIEPQQVSSKMPEPL